MFKILFFLIPFCCCILFSLIVPLLSTYEPNLINLSESKLAPSATHFFGTDILGRDIFVRIAYALRISIFTGFLASFLASFLGIFYILLSRIFLYNFWIRILDVLIAFPSLLIIMFFQSFLDNNIATMSLVIALGHFMFVAKILDSELQKFQKLDFYTCAIILGSSKIKILLFELLPACLNILIILFLLNIAHAISSEATLSFFGLGVPLGEASLGILLNEASEAIFVGAWWMVIFPALSLLFLIIPLFSLANFLQDSLGIKL